MQTIRDLDSLRVARTALVGSVALVPTMGALHAGHLALIAAARARADHVVASVFVNPLQFAPNEDFSTYPRSEASDAAMLADAGVEILWMPDVATMYRAGFGTQVSVDALAGTMCGATRPGHFAGVATVVCKLFNQVRPDAAVFGEKDWQQLAIVQRMTSDLDLPVDIIGHPIQRDVDGVALSSRNAYLTPDERLSARALPRALGEAAAAIMGDAAVEPVLARARAQLEQAGFVIDYVTVVDGDLLPVVTRCGAARIMAAARIGSTRLIDNLPIG